MFETPELQLIRAGLDSLTIRGADAKFLAQLQIKIESQLNEQTPSSPKTTREKK
jgi:hypothetical protein